MEKSFSNRCLYCLRMSEERSYDIMQDSEDLELKTAFRECRSQTAFRECRSIASELKYHQKFGTK